MQLIASDYPTAATLQTAARHWVDYNFAPALEQWIEKYIATSADNYLVIEKLELIFSGFPWQMEDYKWKSEMEASLANIKAEDKTEVIFSQWLQYLQKGLIKTEDIINHVDEYASFWKNNISAIESFVANPKIQWSFSFLYRLAQEFDEEIVIAFLASQLQLSTYKSREIITLFKKMSKPKAILLQQVWPMNTSLVDAKNFLDQLSEEKIETLRHNEVDENIEKELNANAQLAIADTTAIIENAGLVLVLPFLPGFFQNTGLMQDGKFINEESKIIAVEALHFLSTGNTAENDAVLTFPKLIAGLPTHQHLLSPNTMLTDSIKDECEALLQSIVEHWPMLKSTSIDALRSGFLCRRGRAKISEQNIQIEIEQSGLDVLLSGVSWGFRMVKLSWLPYTITTDWY